jgi:beta-lactamase regulating signal transducer with metallopeptidase domain
MKPLMDSITHLSAIAAGSLVNAVLAGVLLAICVGLSLRVLPGVKPAYRFAVWSMVLFASIALHLVPHHVGPESAILTKTDSVHLNPEWAVGIVCAWIAIASMRMARLFYSAIHLHRVAAAATPIAASAACESLLKQAGRPVSLCISDDLDRPSVAGFIHCRILIPREIYSKLSDRELQQIVIHEMEHIRRRDDWTNLLQKIALALFPLNPVVNWVEGQLCMERELACDDCVLRATKSHKAYAYCLTNLAEQSLMRRNLSLALGAWGRRSELVLRVNRILNQPKRSYGRTCGYAVTAAFLVALSGGVVTLARVPALVRFSMPATTVANGDQPVQVEASLVTSVVTSHQDEPVLVKAVMPLQQREVQAARTASRRFAKSIKKHQSRRQNLLVRTRFEGEMAFPRVLLTVDDRNGSSYAAIPVGASWLVIQL